MALQALSRTLKGKVRVRWKRQRPLPKSPPKFKGRPVVRRIDPAKWPYPPEPDCRKDWDAAKA